MIKKIIPYIYVTFFFVFSDGTFAQNFNLKILSKNKKEHIFLSKINYSIEHLDSISIHKEINRISLYLKHQGYFINSIDSVIRNKKNYNAYFSLNEKVEKATVRVLKNNYQFKNIKLQDNTFSVPIEKLQSTLLEISKELDSDGQSFSKVSLKNIQLKNKILYAGLEINLSKKRIINKVVLKGYEKFPNSFIRHYLNIKKGAVFHQKKITDVSNASKNLSFIKEIKPPEVLFTKDSTFIYLYLKKKQHNSFDGLVNFASQENGSILFNGHIDLKLNNILNKGEKFELFWNSIGNESQEFKLSTEIPYLFNSTLTPKISFSIYKQDSTFLNTKFDSKLFYNLNSKAKIAVTYNSENSENLEKTTNNNVKTFSNFFLGVQFEYKIPKEDFLLSNKLYLEVNPNFGKRKTENNALNQFKIETIASYIWDLNSRNSFYIRNKTGYLNSDSFIDNELFRIGGANSIRGFNEQSVFTSNYTYFNFEYRFLTSEKSYFYSITDIGNIKTKIKKETLLGIGLGYLFTTNNSQINVSTALGKNTTSNFNLRNSKLIISWISFF